MPRTRSTKSAKQKKEQDNVQRQKNAHTTSVETTAPHNADPAHGVHSAGSTYRDRLMALMAQRSMSVQALADHMGINYQAVYGILKGKSSGFNAANHACAAALLQVNPDWLATGDGPRHRCSGEHSDAHGTDFRPPWPFHPLLYTRYLLADEKKREMLEQLLDLLLPPLPKQPQQAAMRRAA